MDQASRPAPLPPSWGCRMRRRSPLPQEEVDPGLRPPRDSSGVSAGNAGSPAWVAWGPALLAGLLAGDPSTEHGVMAGCLGRWRRVDLRGVPRQPVRGGCWLVVGDVVDPGRPVERQLGADRRVLDVEER